MVGTLHPDEIEGILHHNHVGRIACVVEEHPYVVPINYVYSGGCVYGHTLPGKKLAAMRTNPHVCFEVDERDDGNVWRSVVADALYEELHDETERSIAYDLLGRTGAIDGAVPVPGVIFRLQVVAKSGRIVAHP